MRQAALGPLPPRAPAETSEGRGPAHGRPRRASGMERPPIRARRALHAGGDLHPPRKPMPVTELTQLAQSGKLDDFETKCLSALESGTLQLADVASSFQHL